MVLEFLDALARVESPEVCTAIFGYPVDSVGACNWLVSILVNFKVDEE